MTDKEVIIDGVNVAECEFYPYVSDDCREYGKCQNNPNCYYKQLQREKIGYQYLLDIHNSSIAEYNNQCDELVEQLRLLHAENEELKEWKKEV